MSKAGVKLTSVGSACGSLPGGASRCASVLLLPGRMDAMMGSSPRPAAACLRCTSLYQAVTAPSADASWWAACADSGLRSER